jgi:hypothetical protein
LAPYRSQAKAVVWDYLKWYAGPLLKGSNEAELQVDLITGARIRLFGADNADAVRGLGFDGMLCDEFGDFKPSVWGNVLRPTLSDRQGWAVFMGTPKGKNQFWEVHDTAVSNPTEWFSLVLRASESGILAEEEVRAVKAQISEDQFLQEYECSFEAAILGAFYGTEMRELYAAGQITEVAYDPSLQCFTAWDIGRTDDTAIWWFQVVRDEIHIIDFWSGSGSSPEDDAKRVLSKPYHYQKHFLPHDAKAKTYASGKSTMEQLISFLGFGNVAITPSLSVQDGINAVRMTLPRCWFDKDRCKAGIEALRQYEREFDEDAKAFRQSPKHNWASHPADAFRYLSIAWRQENPVAVVHPDRPLIVGPGNQATMNDMWAASKRQKRNMRI